MQNDFCSPVPSFDCSGAKLPQALLENNEVFMSCPSIRRDKCGRRDENETTEHANANAGDGGNTAPLFEQKNGHYPPGLAHRREDELSF